MKKYKYNINNLDCANCAREIEEELNKNSNLKNVVVNFSTSKISYEADNEMSLNDLNRLIKKVEPDVSVSQNREEAKKEYSFSILIIGLILSIIGNYIKMPFYINEIIILTAYVLFLYKPFINALKTLIKNKSLNENALITISCIGAYIVNQKMEGLMVVFLYLLGKILEEKAINNTRKSIGDLLNIKQDYANKKIDNKTVKVDIDDVYIDDIIVIKNGERIPVDGIVVKGNTKLNVSALTGESELLDVGENTKVLSGSVNTDKIIEIKVTSEFKDSAVSKILELLEEATDKKAKTETFISKISKIYTPIVLILALLVAIFLPVIFNLSYSESIYRGLIFLVISCPCAIAIAVPLSYFTGIGVSSRNGILIKGSNYLDLLNNLDSIIFDKTGTLTTGNFEVKNIEIFDNNYTEEEIINILVKGESLSNHPIAKSIVKLSPNTSNEDVENYKEISGKGISFKIGNQLVKIGSFKNCECGKSADVHLNIDDKHIASIFISDGIKDKADISLEKLKSWGIKTYMFTGDKKDVALEIGKRLKIDEVKYEMLPTDKYREYEKINGTVAFVGDGINDAPVLKRSDIGISMGSIGTGAAIEASDVVIMTDDLIKIPKAIEISKYTNKIIKQNLNFAISVKLIILILSVFGLATMWAAVFSDTGVTLLTIINTLRILKKFK